MVTRKELDGIVCAEIRYEITGGRCGFAPVEGRDRGSQADRWDSGVGSVIFPKRSCVLQGCSEFAVFVQNIPC